MHTWHTFDSNGTVLDTHPSFPDPHCTPLSFLGSHGANGTNTTESFVDNPWNNTHIVPLLHFIALAITLLQSFNSVSDLHFLYTYPGDLVFLSCFWHFRMYIGCRYHKYVLLDLCLN